MTHEEKRQRRLQIVQEALAGASIDDLSVKYDLQRAYVYNIVQSSGADTYPLFYEAFCKSKTNAEKLEKKLLARKPYDERAKEIAALITAGKSLFDVALKYSLTRERVRQIAAQQGVHSNARQHNYAKGAEVYKKTQDLDEAAKAAGVISKGMRAHLIAKGLIEPVVAIPPRTINILALLINTDKTYEEIARDLNISHGAYVGAVASAAQKAGIKLHEGRIGRTGSLVGKTNDKKPKT